MALSLDGLISGMDTTAVIKALMDVESIPRNLLRAKMDDKGVIISNLQSLNTAIQGLAAKAKDATVPGALSRFTATSSSPSVTVTAGPDAAPVSADIVVDAVAQRHSIVTSAFSAWPVEPPVLTLENSAGELLEITAASGSAQDIARAITASGFGVTASAVPSGTDASGNTLFRLQVTAKEAGADGAFRIFRGSGTSSDLAAEPGAAMVTAGSDARIRLWTGTAAEQVLTSGSGTFTGLFPGVDFTVTAASATPVTLTVSSDLAAQKTAHGDFVKQLAGILTRIDNGSKATVPGGVGETTTLGVFTGDSTVRALRGALADAIQRPVDGISPSTVGISIDRHGVLTFDETKFAAALAEDPAAVEAVFSGVAARVQQVSERYSDKYDGLLTSRITGQQNEVRSLGDQIGRWDVRLAQRKLTLERTYSQLETMLGRLKSQSDYLGSQLAALPKSPSGDSR
jgi:flagellar hook-associated protein 2